MYVDVKKKDPFEPPQPEPTTASDMAAGAAVAVGAVLLEHATGGLLSALPGFGGETEVDPEWAARYNAKIAAESVPFRRTEDGRVLCTGCDAAVTFESMSLSEDGYFCQTCVDHIRG